MAQRKSQSPIVAGLLAGVVIAATSLMSGAPAMASGGGHYATSRGGVASCHQISVRGDLAYHVFMVNRDGRWRVRTERAQRAGKSNRFDTTDVHGFILRKKRVALIQVDASPWRIPRANRTQWRKLGCPLDY